jgi:hypothetical protein
MRDPYGSINSILQTGIDRAFAKPNSRTRPGFGTPGLAITTELPDDRVPREAGSGGTSKRGAGEEEKGMTVLSTTDPPPSALSAWPKHSRSSDVSAPAPNRRGSETRHRRGYRENQKAWAPHRQR